MTLPSIRVSSNAVVAPRWLNWRLLNGRLLAITVLLIGLASAPSAFGQIMDDQVFSFSPNPPVAGQNFLMTLEVQPCLHGVVLVPADSLDRDVSVWNGRIEVTVPYFLVFVCTPGLGGTTVEVNLSMSALKQGDYELVVYGQDISHPEDPAFRRPIYATSISVVAQPASEPRVISATSSWWLLMLAGICSAFGVLRLRVDS